MGRVTITLPRLGETMEEARVTDWLVPVGAAFKRGDVLLEVETDKTVVEVPALTDGVLLAQLVAPGEMVALDQPIAEVEAEGGSVPVKAAEPARDPAAKAAPPLRALAMPHVPDGPRPAASPAARAAARRAGVDLALVAGSGRRGRITAEDVAEDAGGVTVVLLHGLFDDSRGWRDLPPRLRAAGARVVTLDLPGHGQNPVAAHSFDTAVAQVAAALPAGPLHLVGHSLGGAIAAALAPGLGARLSGLTLLAPAGLGPGVTRAFIPAMLGAETPEALTEPLALLDAGPISTAGLAQELDRLRLHRAGHAAMARVASGEAGPLPDLPALLAHLACPVTVMMGVQDRIIDWRGVANLPAGVAIHLVREAGHLPQHAAAEVFLRLVHPAKTQEGRPGRARDA